MQGFRVLQCHLPSLPLEAPSRLPAVLQIPIPRCAAGIRIISHQLSLIIHHSSEWAPSAHKQPHYVRKTLRATPKGANFRASEGKASSSLECSAERSRESTKLTFYCVKHHEQPRRGESLFASTEQPVYRLSPLYP